MISPTGGRDGVALPIKTAVLSECGAYRYALTRQWADGLLLPIMMLNPSTADADVDDPTIRRCMGFGRREGFAGIEVHNLSAFRATDPKSLVAARGPVGPENDVWLEKLAVSAATPILCAWGANGGLMGRDAQVLKIFRSVGTACVCLGRTKAGHPSHPLYLSRYQPLEVFLS